MTSHNATDQSDHNHGPAPKGLLGGIQEAMGDAPIPLSMSGDGQYLDGERYRRAALEHHHICQPPMIFAPSVDPNGDTRYRPGVDAMYRCGRERKPGIACNTLWVMRKRTQTGGGHYPGKGLYWRRVHWWEFTKRKIFNIETMLQTGVIDATHLPQVLPKAPTGPGAGSRSQKEVTE